MLNNHTNKATVTVDGTIIEKADKYICLGKTVTRDGYLTLEIKRCTALGWAAFSKADNIMRSYKAVKKIKMKVLSEYVILVTTYGSET